MFPRFSSLQILQEIQNGLRKRNIEPERFTDHIILVSMFNDTDWSLKGNEGFCVSNAENVKECAKRFSQGHWTFLGPGDEKKWYGIPHYTPEGQSDFTANQMVERFKEVIQCSRVYQCFESWNSEKRSMTGTQDTSMRLLRTPSCCSESFSKSAQYLLISFEVV